ncbi:alkyl hydroperoxide reductase AhpD [Thalassotalea insulae]|uniref:Alkyl hydroperoxide reductase AhpD n=1 Tax=Thalassotalea insulae TaxID=2056778 RepID=A0ABQ6GXX7_9GAMM|nr:carboxymuconolactone decarboxylase family protein [Thalassotalea insulae]GLX80197.1 alkyl hydroperoxide reductase AhpD [Thalassotalea insulae]
MKARLNYVELAPKALEILLAQESYLKTEFIDGLPMTVGLWELVKMRVSQINQCAFCLDMHYHEAVQQGVSVEKLYGLNAWRDMPFYSQAESVALAWAESLTAGERIDEQRYQEALSVFGDKGLINLTIAVNAINSWNRFAKIFKPEIGSYKPN